MAEATRKRTKEELAGQALGLIGLFAIPTLIGLIVFVNSKKANK